MTARAARLPPSLLALSPGSLTERSAPEFLGRLNLARRAGLEGLLLREPDLSERAFLALARAAARRLQSRPGAVWLGLHDRAHLVSASGADGLHLGFRSLCARAARAIMPASVAIGFSSHAGDAPELFEGADYLFHGPLFETPSKAGRLEPIGALGLAAFTAESGLPVWALGGVEPEHARELCAAGARGVAVLSGILGQADASAVTAAVEAYHAALVAGRGGA